MAHYRLACKEFLPGSTPDHVASRKDNIAMSIVAELFDSVVGVDTHAATHTLVVVDATTGAERHRSTFPTSPAGLTRAVSWIRRRTIARVLVVVEGVGSYGALVADALAAAGMEVCEPSPIPPHHGQGKSDDLDAARIARSVLGVDIAMLRHPRSDTGPRVALRVLVIAREEMTADRTRAINALTALLRTIDLGMDARRPLTTSQVTTITGWRARQEATWLATCRGEAVRLARHIRDLDHQIATNRAQLDTLVAAHAPELTTLTGVGSVVAATVLVAWSHPGRIRSEAAFAALAGTCPIPASSGNTIRHRLNRGGDRRLNRALHTVVLVRMRVDPGTRAYVARRRAEGRTTKEIMRSLKRYVTRQLFRALPAAPLDTT